MPKLFCLEITISSSLSQYGKILSFEIFFEYKKNLRRWPKCYVAVVVSKKMTSFMPAYSDGFRDGHAFLVSLSCLPSILGPMECKFFTGMQNTKKKEHYFCTPVEKYRMFTSGPKWSWYLGWEGEISLASRCNKEPQYLTLLPTTHSWG